MANYPGIFQDASGNNILPTPNSYANTIETGNTASQAYVKGAPVLRNVPGGDTNKNGLFRAKTAIASGATFTVGTNIEKVNVGDLANQLWANGSAFYLDVQNNEYGYNTSASRGADTFVPFKGTSIKKYDMAAHSSKSVAIKDGLIYGYCPSYPTNYEVADSFVNGTRTDIANGNVSYISKTYNNGTYTLNLSSFSLPYVLYVCEGKITT